MLTGLDESLLHQAALPFGTPVTSDHRFYDRCWVATYDPAGDFALNMGLGVYANMNVTDGFVCCVDGHRQHNVRVSRELRPDLDGRTVGPLGYEVVVPFEHLRVRLEQGHGAVACELDWVARMPAFHEAPTTTRVNGRLATDVQRYDQVGVVNGWIELDGVRHEVVDWFGARDHSWGVRGGVGGFEPNTGSNPFGTGFLVTWLLFATEDGAGYVQVNRDGTGAQTFMDGRLRWADGRDDRRLVTVDQDIRFPKGSRLYESATIQLVDDIGTKHLIECERLGPPIVMRGAGYDNGWSDGAGLGVHRGLEIIEADTYDITKFDAPTLDGNSIYGMQREQPVRVVVDGDAGVGDFTVLAFGDLEFAGVASDATPLPRAPRTD
jgi:hypothetical protein